MKTIGLIDYFIDEWHAHNYPKMIRESRYADQFDVSLAWEHHAKPGGMDIDTWCREQNVSKAVSIEQVVESCDCIVVLSPDNAEQHEALADLPLRSGKPVYIDKPIAPTLAAAKRLFDKAAHHDTPMMSCSALRFAPPLEAAQRAMIADQAAQFVSTRGGGRFEVYAIHQLEQIVMILGVGATRVMEVGNDHAHHLIIDYPDHRRATMTLIPGLPFELSMRSGEDQAISITSMGDFFGRFVEGMLTFFDTRSPMVPPQQTLEIAALIEAGIAATQQRDTWIDVPKA